MELRFESSYVLGIDYDGNQNIAGKPDLGTEANSGCPAHSTPLHSPPQARGTSRYSCLNVGNSACVRDASSSGIL